MQTSEKIYQLAGQWINTPVDKSWEWFLNYDHKYFEYYVKISIYKTDY